MKGAWEAEIRARLTVSVGARMACKRAQSCTSMCQQGLLRQKLQARILHVWEGYLGIITFCPLKIKFGARQPLCEIGVRSGLETSYAFVVVPSNVGF
jgi:hypothetical protein